MTDLFNACCIKDYNNALDIIDTGAYDLNKVYNFRGYELVTLPIICAANGDEKTLNLILQTARDTINLDHQDKNGRTALMAALINKHEKCAMTILKNKYFTNINAKMNSNAFYTTKGDTALIIACKNKLFDIVDFILTYTINFDANACNTYGLNALIWSCMHNQTDVALTLIQHTHNINSPILDYDGNILYIKGDTALSIATWHANEQIVLALLDRKDIDMNTCDMFGNTPLISACRQKHVDMALQLIRRGANINIRSNHYRDTALCLAIKNCLGQVIDAILTKPNFDFSQIKLLKLTDKETMSINSIKLINLLIEHKETKSPELINYAVKIAFMEHDIDLLNSLIKNYKNYITISNELLTYVFMSNKKDFIEKIESLGYKMNPHTIIPNLFSDLVQKNFDPVTIYKFLDNNRSYITNLHPQDMVNLCGMIVKSMQEEHLNCKICFCKKIDTVFDPCGHAMSCSNCTSDVLKRCPICTLDIKAHRKVYF